MSFKAFYCRYRDDFSQDTPTDMEADEIVDFANDVLESNDDFFGVVDSAGVTFQIMVEGGDYWIEIPYPDRGGSFGRRVDKTTVMGILKNLPPTFDESMIAGGSFQAW